MANTETLIRTNMRRILGLDDRSAVIGDVNGVIYEPGRSGYVRVRYPSSDGYGYPTVVRLAITAQLTPGLPVKVGWKDGEQQVKALDNKAIDAGNWNGYTGATVNQQTNAVDLNTSPILISTAFGAAKPLYVTLLAFKYVRNGTVHSFGGVSGGIDLSSYIPGSVDQHCVVAIFLTPSDTSEVKSSAAQSTSEPITDSDFQECFTASTDGSLPVAIWRLKHGQTLIADTDKILDWRQWINVPESDFATLQTTGNTQTTIASVAVAELSLVTITGMFSGVKSDYSAAISGTFVAGIRRASGGNATLVGVTVTSNEDSAGMPSFTVDADTGTQTARMRVTGITAETWNWTVKYQMLTT